MVRMIIVLLVSIPWAFSATHIEHVYALPQERHLKDHTLKE